MMAKLHAVARTEAELMFREYNRDSKIAPPVTSARISNLIMRTHDAVAEVLRDQTEDELGSLLELVQQHLPGNAVYCMTRLSEIYSISYYSLISY